MPTQNVSTMPDTAFVGIDHTSGLSQTRGWVATAWERGNQWIRSPLLRIRPKVSLFSGSVLVLLTLFLPIAYQACGPNKTGYEFVRESKGDWPTFLGSISHQAGREFYILSLALAALTILVLLALRRRDLLRRRRLIGGLFVIAGTISLFAMLDLFVLDVVLAVDGLTARGAHYDLVWNGLPMILALLSCFSPALAWRRKGLVVWIIALTSGIALPLTLRHSSLAILPFFIFAFLPLAVWYRFRFSRHDEIRAQWPRIRRGLIAFCIPAVLGDCFLFGGAVSEGVWGLLPYFIGISLISLGYMQLEREAKMSVNLRFQPERGPSLTHPARM